MFSHAAWSFVCLPWINVYLDLLPSFWLGCLFFFEAELYKLFVYLEIKPLLVASFANIFSHSVRCLFVEFMVCFVVQKLLSLFRSHLFYFSFYFHYSRRRIQKNIVAIYVKDCSLFPPRSFIMSSLTRRSLIHFEFNFVYGVRERSDFILLRVAIQFFRHQLLKSVPFFWLFFITPFYLQKRFNTPDVCTFAPPMPCCGQPL